MAIVIGLALWWFLARTRVGMMIRAGVDDRAMLSASGVNVQMVFAITFAIGAGLAGFAGVVGGTACRSRRARTRAICWPRWSWSSSAAWAACRAPRWARADRPRRAVRPGLCADLRHRLHLRDHGAGAGLPAAGHPGEARMSAAHWRKAMNFTAPSRNWSGGPGDGRARRARRRRQPAVRRRRHPAGRGVISACATSSCWPRCSSIPGSCRRSSPIQIGGQALILGLIALSLTFLGRLRRHAVAGADDRGRHRRLHRRDPGRQRHARDQPGLAMVAGRRAGGHAAARSPPPHRLAVGAHRGHLHHHDHAGDRHGVLLPGPAELRDLQRLPGLPEGRAAGGARHRLAHADAVLLSRAVLGARRLLLREVPDPRAVRHRAAGRARQRRGA